MCGICHSAHSQQFPSLYYPEKPNKINLKWQLKGIGPVGNDCGGNSSREGLKVC